jgi:hypothetical protein
MTQSLLGAVTGLYAAVQACFASTVAPDGSPVLALFGMPDQYQPQCMVAVLGAGGQRGVTRPTMGTNRSRELMIEIEVMFSVYVEGGQEAHATCMTTMAALIRLFEEYMRTSPNEKLGGACYDSWVSDVGALAPTIAYDPDSVQAGQPVPTGRVVETSTVVTAKIRY